MDTCIFSTRNIMMLLNAFNLAEGAITEDNYNDMLQNLNSTISGSQVIEGLDLNTCDLRTFLSDVRFICRISLSIPESCR